MGPDAVPIFAFHLMSDAALPLAIAAQRVPSLPEILPFAAFCPAGFFIRENDTPALIPVDDHCETAQVPERHDQFAFLRCQIVHHCSPSGLNRSERPRVKKGSDPSRDPPIST